MILLPEILPQPFFKNGNRAHASITIIASAEIVILISFSEFFLFFFLRRFDSTSTFGRMVSIKPTEGYTCDEIGWLVTPTAHVECQWESLKLTPFFMYSRTPEPAYWPSWIVDEGRL